MFGLSNWGGGGAIFTTEKPPGRSEQGREVGVGNSASAVLHGFFGQPHGVVK